MEERVEGLNEVKANKVDVVMVADLANLMAEQAQQLDGRLEDYQKENAKVWLVAKVCLSLELWKVIGNWGNKVDVVRVAGLASLMAEQARQAGGLSEGEVKGVVNRYFA